MSDRIQQIIDGIPTMSQRQRAEWMVKATRVLGTKPGDPDALRLLAALEAAKSEHVPAQVLSTGYLEWEPHDSSKPSFAAFHQGQIVGRIFKSATHTATRKEVYSVEVEGVVLPQRFHRISEARAAGEAEFRLRHGITS